jgi:fibro-slime domain-containing protein
MAKADLDPNGKPAYDTSRNGGGSNAFLCDCQFTDWSHDTNGGHVPGYTATISPTTGLTYTSGANGHPMYKGPAPIVKDATSFSQWFTDGTFTGNTHKVVALQLSPIGNGQYRFSSDPNSVTGGFFPLDPAGVTPPPGTVRTQPDNMEPLLCNLWPYWYSSAQFGAGANCVGDQYVFPPSVDPTAAECANPGAGMVPCANGMWKPAAQGTFHDFWYTTEARYLFVFNGAFELQFYGDDDLFIYINGKLVLDLGGVHQRLPGRAQVSETGMATIIEGGEVDPASGIINPCTATANPYTLAVNNATCTGGTCDCRERTLNLGLEMGKTYEIAVFHADRHPTESNYQLTLSGFATNRSNCQPRCGDAVRTGAEECDDGDMNDDSKYGGCNTMCKFGPFCGDGMTNGPEECDLGKDNGTTYGSKDGCTFGCKFPHYCGDANVDSANGEGCDQGADLNGQPGSLCDKNCHIIID